MHTGIVAGVSEPEQSGTSAAPAVTDGSNGGKRYTDRFSERHAGHLPRSTQNRKHPQSMSKQKPRRKRNIAQNPLAPEQTGASVATQTGGATAAPSDVHFNFQLNQLNMSGDAAGLLQLVRMMPEPLQERAMRMAEKEQEARLEEIRKEGDRHHELEMSKQGADFQLQEQRQSNIYHSELSGKIFGLLFFGGFLFSLMYSCITGNWEGVAAILGCATVLGILIKGFVWLMGQNKNTPPTIPPTH